MTLHNFLQLTVCVFSVLAAGFWLQSTTNRLPKLAKGLKESGNGSLLEALMNQSRWSAAAAACFGIAAFSQGIAVLIPYIG